MAAIRIHRYTDTAEDAIERQILAEQQKRNAAEAAEGMSEALAEPPKKPKKSRFKPIRAARNAGIAPFDSIYFRLVQLAVAAVAVYLTAEGTHPIGQIIAYILTLACVIGLDPLKAVTLFLAPQTRIIITANLLLIIPALLKPDKKYIAVLTVFIFVSAVICRISNRNWLYCYNWLASASAQRAVIKCPDAKGCTAWNKTGRREARTALAECGLNFNDDLLDSYGQTLYLVGFYSGFMKTEKVKRRAGKVLEELENIIDYSESLEEQNALLNSDIQNKDYEMDEMRTKAEMYRTATIEREATEKKLKAAYEENEALKRVNAELAAAAPESIQKGYAEISADIEEKKYSDLDSAIIHELRTSEELRSRGQKGKGTRAIAKEYNVTRYYVECLQKDITKSNIVQFPEPETSEACKG